VEPDPVKGHNSPLTGPEDARMGDQAKRVVFRYNDNEKDTDVEVDILGDLPQYAVGDIVARRGKSLDSCSGCERTGPHRLTTGSSLYRDRHR
jgi:hypothetical protein